MLTGELWSMDLGDPVDTEAGLFRPALVVSPHRFTGPFRVVCPLTTTLRTYPWRLEVEPDAANGLPATCYMQTEQLRSISTARGVRRLGSLDAVAMKQVRRVLALLLDLP